MDPMLMTETGFSGEALAVNNGKQAWVKEKIRFKFKFNTFSKAASG